MTMPSKIWIDETSEDEEGFILGRFDREYANVDRCYIRADITDELARALDWLYHGKGEYACAEKALSRYYEAIDTNTPS